MSITSTSPGRFDQKNRCVNCLFKTPKTMRTLCLAEMPASLVNTLLSWITPSQILPESVICKACYELLEVQVSMKIEEDTQPLPAFGHRSVCYPCGSSILNRRTYSVEADCQERKILLQFVPNHLISKMKRVCSACWRAVRREVMRQQHRDTYRPVLTEVAQADNVPEPPLPQPPVRIETPKIVSAVYRRAASSSNHCIFYRCLEKERLLIPSHIRKLLLYEYKFFVPDIARICRRHLAKGTWSILTSQLRDFTGPQFDKIMETMQQSTNYQIDFSNIAMMPPHLCKYWLGMDCHQFYELLNSIPNLTKRVPNATLALSMYLVKLRTGDKNERIATLFNTSRTTLQRLMSEARSCLMNK